MEWVLCVMAGLVPAIHVFVFVFREVVDARNKSGHDEDGEPLARHLYYSACFSAELSERR